MFVSLGLSGVVPILHGLEIYGYQGLEDRTSVSWVILHGALYIFGAVLYAVSPHTQDMPFRAFANLLRFAGRRGLHRGHSTSGAVRIRSSTSLSSWRRLRIYTPWQRRSTTTTLSWVRSV